MDETIAGQVVAVEFDDVKFLGRLVNWYRVMREGGLLYEDLQTPITDAEMRARLIQNWQAGAPILPQQAARAPQPAVSTYPKIGEVFELTLKPVSGLELVRLFGYPNWPQWKFNGKEITEPRIRRFKLDQVGYCPNLDAVRQKLGADNVPEGQWIQAFTDAYPEPDGQGPVGVADSSWVYPSGYAFFPCVDAGGLLRFHWAGLGRGVDWRWLVPASE